MAVWMPASVLLNCLAAAEIATGRSRIAALRPTVLNASVMTGIVLVRRSPGKLLFLRAFRPVLQWAWVWGVWTLWREGELSRQGLRAAGSWRRVPEFFGRLRPLFALPFAEQGQLWIERVVASGFAGDVASIDYARTLTDSALLLISQPVGLGVLSSHFRQHARARIEAIACPVLAVALPAAAFLVVFAPDIVWLVFYRGAFTETAVALTSQALRGIAFGLWASTLGWILLRTLNSTGRNARAAFILVAAYAANPLVNLGTAGIQEATGLGHPDHRPGRDGAQPRPAHRHRARTGLPASALLSHHGGARTGRRDVAARMADSRELAGALHRVLAGGLLCLLCIALEVVVLMPAACQAAIRLICTRISITRTT